MSIKPNKAIGLSVFLERVKEDLLLNQTTQEPKLFSIDEITVEINFVVTGDIESGFNLGVVTLGSQISEERTQKVSIKLTPLVPKEQLIQALNKDTKSVQKIVKTSSDILLRGEEPTKTDE